MLEIKMKDLTDLYGYVINFLIGKAKQNVDPSPSMLLTQILPLPRLIISEDMYNPNPRPGKV